jgi:hypothetical protein
MASPLSALGLQIIANRISCKKNLPFSVSAKTISTPMRKIQIAFSQKTLGILSGDISIAIFYLVFSKFYTGTCSFRHR